MNKRYTDGGIGRSFVHKINYVERTWTWRLPMLGSPCGSVLNACATLTQLIIASFGGCKKVEDIIRCWMQNPGFFWLDRPCPTVNTSSAASSVKKFAAKYPKWSWIHFSRVCSDVVVSPDPGTAVLATCWINFSTLRWYDTVTYIKSNMQTIYINIF